MSSWAPLSADLERGIVYVPTNAPTIDYYGGFRPGDNLFGDSVIALDVETGRRLWHFQLDHHPIWNYEIANVPILADLTVNGQEVPALIQATKQGMTFAFNRVTGEPVWPIEERPVPRSIVPGEKLSPTQPFPTRPAPLNPLGLSEDDVIDFTPELKQEALEIMKQYRIGGPYMPPLPNNHAEPVKGWIWCSGGINITHPAALDPEALGGRGRAVLMVTKSLLFATEGINERAVLNAHDKTTGRKLGTVELPAPGQYGMMTYMHEGRQFVVVQIGEGGTHPGSLAALALPHDAH